MHPLFLASLSAYYKALLHTTFSGEPLHINQSVFAVVAFFVKFQLSAQMTCIDMLYIVCMRCISQNCTEYTVALSCILVDRSEKGRGEYSVFACLNECWRWHAVLMPTSRLWACTAATEYSHSRLSATTAQAHIFICSSNNACHQQCNKGSLYMGCVKVTWPQTVS